MTRLILPPRRPSHTLATEWQGHPISVTVGLYPESGRPGEVFADVLHGGQMQAVLSDACVLISIALQHGIPPEALAKSLAQVPDPARGKGATASASPVGAIVAALCEVAL